ncbi:MAG: recombinase family protein, partial [Clostridium perfringens]
IFEAYEDDILTKQEFQIRKDELNEKIRILEEEKKPLINTISEEVSEEIPYDFIKDILMNFSKILNSSVSREQQKKLLHMIISEITMNESREIDSIKLNINDKLVEYLVKEGGVPIKGIPSSFMLRNVGVSILNLSISI